MRVREKSKRYGCALLGIVSAALLMPQGAIAHPHPEGGTLFPRIMPTITGTEGMLDVQLRVETRAGGYTVPFNGGTRTFCHKYTYDIEMWDEPGSPNQFIGGVFIPNCNTPYGADAPVQWITPFRAGRGTPQLWTTPRFVTSPSTIAYTTATPITSGIRFASTWRFCIYSDQEPVPGNITVTGQNCPTDTSCSPFTFAFNYFVPCGASTCNPGGPGIPPKVPPTCPPANCPPQNPPPGSGNCVHNINIAQVYPAVNLPGTPSTEFPFQPLGCFVGATVTPFPRLCVPGVLCLDTAADRLLNVNSFITNACCAGNVAVQNVTLVKQVPGSARYPLCYPPQTYTQNGRQNIRTWWALNYTQPGTKFTLTITGTCTTPGTPPPPGNSNPPLCPRHNAQGHVVNFRVTCNGNHGGPGQNPGQTPGKDPGQNPGQTPGQTSPYTETWCWVVVATPETFRCLVDMLHMPALGLTEIPCIADEAVYAQLVTCAESLRTAIANFRANGTAANRAAALAAIQSCESFILANSLVAGSLFEADEVIDFPNGNFTPAGAGIIATCENPCDCKLLADLEYIQAQNGL